MLWVAEDTMVGSCKLQEAIVAQGGVWDHEVGHWGKVEEGNRGCG